MSKFSLYLGLAELLGQLTDTSSYELEITQLESRLTDLRAAKTSADDSNREKIAAFIKLHGNPLEVLVPMVANPDDIKMPEKVDSQPTSVEVLTQGDNPVQPVV